MEKKSGSRRKAWLFQGIVLGILVLGICFLFAVSGDERYSHVMNGEGYESTESFGALFYSDMEKAIRYTRLAELLETDGELNLQAEIAELPVAEDVVTSITLQDAIYYGESLGLYFDEDNNLIISDGGFDWKAGASNKAAAARELPVEAEQNTLEEYAEYYSGYKGDLVQEEMEENKFLLKLLYQLAEYYELQEYLGMDESITNFAYRFVYLNASENVVVAGNRKDAGSVDDIVDLGCYFWMNSERDYLTYTFYEDVVSDIYSAVTQGGLLAGNTYEIVAGVDTAFPIRDQYSEGYEAYCQFRWMVYGAWAVLGIGVLGMLAAFVCMICTSKKTSYDLDRWYTEAAAVALLLPSFFLVWAVLGIRDSFRDYDVPTLCAGLFFGCLMYYPVIIGISSMIRRRAARDIFGRSLIIWAGRELMTSYQNVLQGRTSIFWATIFYLAGNVFFSGGLALVLEGFLMTGVLGVYRLLMLFVCVIMLLIINVAMFIYAARRARHGRRITEALIKISDGAIDTRIDTSGMRGQDKDMADTINAIGDGLIKAVEEQTRSERMKTDLIANVSHDLRTPLTSIINYVDLLKREKLENPKAKEYLDILESKSQRMKHLTEDLMEASKVSSGNVTVNWERIDLVQMVNQMEGEFQEKFEASELTPVTDLVAPPVYIMADGRLLFRVLENLYNNVCKYAMRGSRVYIDLKETSHKAVFTMKNISADPLNISADELTGRFVRGDVSRSTEGSGLGLSIAQSITELLKGTFEIYLEGDLFRVRLVFPLDEEDRS